MATLHESATITYFAGKCKKIWDDWNNGQAGERVQKRKSAIKNNLLLLMNRIGIKPLEITFINQPGVAGQFGWGDWEIEIGPAELVKHDIACEKFVDLCVTFYHETRHAEQFTRMAQGVRLARLRIPGLKKLPVFGKAHVIAKAMGMNYAATNYAANHRNDYIVFAATPRQSHCTIGSAKGWDNWDPTVDDWLQRTYNRNKSTFSEIGQSDDVNDLPNIGGQYAQGGGTMDIVGGRRGAIEQQYYFRAEDEKDAYAIEKLFTAALANQFVNYQARKGWKRTDPRW
ncbi:MAG: hypothetical protein HY885_01075 [Deltaproteobacteria bacterium]|nr:hypothetical protein [Deltaproteobacteria bacterium]